MENISKEMEVMEMEHEIRQMRKDLTGDVLQSAKLVLAATEKKWDEVEKLLEKGADPRICRQACITGEIIPALYMALKDQQFALAAKLYDAGDRLDDFIDYPENNGSCPDVVISFLAREMRWGRNYFLDESKTLSECCRCAEFVQIEKLMPNASQEELNKSILPTVYAWRRYFNQTGLFMDILKDLVSHGAKLSDEDKAELMDFFEAIKKWPAVMRPAAEDLETISDFIKNC
ncbi:MAG: hypothetical protein J6W00_05140 [Lentisphaeria bacterium]|nr:hypothetical protein [Lentisphaeria bacterium]